jgi:hypothetical protein
MDLNSDLNSVSTPKRRGGARAGAGRPRKSKPDLIPSKEDQITQIQKLLAANPPAREAVVLTRQLGQLTGQIKTYARTKAEREQPPQEPPRPLSEPLWVRRGNLIEAIADRFANASEQVLTPDEIEAGMAVEFSPEQLLRFVNEWIWDHAHLNEVRALQESFVEDHPEIALPVNTPGHWVSHLKAYPLVTVTAGPTLTPDELRDVTEFRAKAASAREQVRRTLYERFPDRLLDGFTNCSEYDAAHPGESILKCNAFPRWPHERWQ